MTLHGFDHAASSHPDLRLKRHNSFSRSWSNANLSGSTFHASPFRLPLTHSRPGHQPLLGFFNYLRFRKRKSARNNMLHCCQRLHFPTLLPFLPHPLTLLPAAIPSAPLDAAAIPSTPLDAAAIPSTPLDAAAIPPASERKKGAFTQKITGTIEIVFVVHRTGDAKTAFRDSDHG